jgi:hypothetical protein
MFLRALCGNKLLTAKNAKFAKKAEFKHQIRDTQPRGFASVKV